MQEILGSGDATTPPCSSRSSRRRLPTSPRRRQRHSIHLQVWVNNLHWHEIPNLLTAGPADRVFVTSVEPRRQDRGSSSATACRERALPPAQSNIRAVYRKGIGSAGMVSAGQLSQPLDRPQGVKSVTNPSPASGAADPATAAEARASAPLADADDRPSRVAGGLPELCAGLRRDRQGTGDLDVVRRRPRRVPDRGRRQTARHSRPTTRRAHSSLHSIRRTIRTFRFRSPHTCPVHIQVGASVRVDHRRLRPRPGPRAGVANRRGGLRLLASASSARMSSPAKIIEIIQAHARGHRGPTLCSASSRANRPGLAAGDPVRRGPLPPRARRCSCSTRPPRARSELWS